MELAFGGIGKKWNESQFLQLNGKSGKHWDSCRPQGNSLLVREFNDVACGGNCHFHINRGNHFHALLYRCVDDGLRAAEFGILRHFVDGIRTQGVFSDVAQSKYVTSCHFTTGSPNDSVVVLRKHYACLVLVLVAGQVLRYAAA